MKLAERCGVSLDMSRAESRNQKATAGGHDSRGLIAASPGSLPQNNQALSS